jgi:hypothetical protein
VLAAVDAKSQVDSNVLSFAADTAGGATTWTVGDNKCFTVPTVLKLSVVKKGKSRTVSAALSVVGGSPIVGQPVVFTVNGKRAATVTTNAAGVATLKTAAPGQKVVATFAGAEGYDPSTASVKL